MLRENPRGILALAYNRHAAAEIRKRLRKLIGNDANGVTVLTCHALAMRLTGSSFADRLAQDVDFTKVLADAVQLLKGEGLLADEADDQRERLLSGFRWILVDEYQDIGAEQYELISALAGRTLNDPERKISLFAVGDDDQNVYGFAGASVKYIRRFQEDYRAKPEFLTDNYRSTANIIDASNGLISLAVNRMKADHPIEIDHERRADPGGGLWGSLDPVVKGRVQILNVGSSFTSQAEQVMQEMIRLSELDPKWNWSNAAIIARQWRLLHPVFAFCEANKIPAQRAEGRKLRDIKIEATGRLFEQAFAQNGVLTNAEVALLLKISPTTVTNYTRAWEEKNGRQLPRRGTVHDMGPTLTHKRIIIHKLFIEQKTVETVAKETNHSFEAIQRYIGDFRRVLLCRKNGMTTEQISNVIRHSKRLVREYEAIIEHYGGQSKALKKLLEFHPAIK